MPPSPFHASHNNTKINGLGRGTCGKKRRKKAIKWRILNWVQFIFVPIFAGSLDKTESQTCRFHSWAPAFLCLRLRNAFIFSRSPAVCRALPAKQVEWTLVPRKILLIGVTETDRFSIARILISMTCVRWLLSLCSCVMTCHVGWLGIVQTCAWWVNCGDGEANDVLP